MVGVWTSTTKWTRSKARSAQLASRQTCSKKEPVPIMCSGHYVVHILRNDPDLLEGYPAGTSKAGRRSASGSLLMEGHIILQAYLCNTCNRVAPFLHIRTDSQHDLRRKHVPLFLEEQQEQRSFEKVNLSRGDGHFPTISMV